MKVQKDINFSSGLDDDNDKDKEVVTSNRENYEREMKQVQKLWVNRTHKLFYMFLGFLAGMSLMQLLFLMTPSTDKLQFLQLYSRVSVAINIVFMIFTSLALILGLALTLIFKHKSDEKMRNMDPYRLEFRQHYVVSLVITIFIAFC